LTILITSQTKPGSPQYPHFNTAVCNYY